MSGINLPLVVVGLEAPDHVQNMATDINDTINRLNSVLTTSFSDLQAAVDALEAAVAALEAQAAIYDVGAYGR